MLLSFNHVIAAIQQLALGVTFLLIGVAARRYGDQAQQAAEQEVNDQGITKEKDFLLSPLS